MADVRGDLADIVRDILHGIDDLARVDREVEADLAADAERETDRAADVELAVVAHAELAAGLGTDAGPSLAVHTGADTRYLRPGLALDLRARERLGAALHTGPADVALGAGLRADHALRRARNPRVVAKFDLAFGAALGKVRLGACGAGHPHRADGRAGARIGPEDRALQLSGARPRTRLEVAIEAAVQ